MGNRTARTVGAASETYAYDAASNRLLSVTGAATRSLTYSDSGNTSQDDKGGGTVLDYAYASSDRLVAVTQGAATVADYVHNAMGQRVAKTVGGATTHFVYDLSGRLVAEADGATGAATAEYVWLEGMPLAFITGGAIYYVHADHLGTPQRLTDGSKAVVWDASYAPFGGATVSGPLTFNLRFPGQYRDMETGLHYNYFRDYDLALGRYVQSDPIGLEGGLNLYLYAEANPIAFADPYGQNPLLVRIGIIGLRIALAAARAAKRKIEQAYKYCKDIRCKIQKEGPHHFFPGHGWCPHKRLTCWEKGVKQPPFVNLQWRIIGAECFALKHGKGGPFIGD